MIEANRLCLVRETKLITYLLYRLIDKCPRLYLKLNPGLIANQASLAKRCISLATI